MSTLVALAAVAALATNPSCGGAAPGSDLAKRLVAVAEAESSFDPLAIHINGPNGGARRFADKASAVAFATKLDAAGIDWDGGLLGINRRNFGRHHLSVETVFDACANMRAASEHLADDFKAAAWTLAHRRYNCGSVDCGSEYAAKVNRLLNETLPQPKAAPPPSPSVDDDPSDPEPPRWDVFGHVEWESRAADRAAAPPTVVKLVKEPQP